MTTHSINSPNDFNNYLNESIDLPQDEDQIDAFLNNITSKLNYINQDNVILLSILLKNHVFRLLDAVPGFRPRYEGITKFIFGKTDGAGRNYMHQFAREGNNEGVKALVRLDPRQVNTESVQSNRTALSYANQFHRDEIEKYLNLFDAISTPVKHISFDRLDDIQCTKGTPPSGLSHNEGLIQSIGRIGLKIVRNIAELNVSYYFTQTFTYTDRFQNRPLIFCFVEKDHKLYPRLFWLSNSQSIWRRVDKIFGNYIGKSKRGEEGLAMPINVNISVFRIHEETPKPLRNLPSADGKSFMQYVIDWSEHSIDGGWFLKDGKKVFETLEGTDSATEVGADSLPDDPELRIKMGPEELPPNPTENNLPRNALYKPDFSQPNPEFSILTPLPTSPFYGSLEARIFLSFNKRIRYLFLEQQDTKHVFLAATEIVQEPITHYGLKRRWLDLGSLSLPLKEYRSQFRYKFLSKSDKTKLENGEKLGYVSTWNYLREMPFIKDYYGVPPSI